MWPSEIYVLEIKHETEDVIYKVQKVDYKNNLAIDCLCHISSEKQIVQQN